MSEIRACPDIRHPQYLRAAMITYLELKALSFLPLKKKPFKTVMAFCLSSSLAKLMNMYVAPGPHCLKRWGFKPRPSKSFFAWKKNKILTSRRLLLNAAQSTQKHCRVDVQNLDKSGFVCPKAELFYSKNLQKSIRFNLI